MVTGSHEKSRGDRVQEFSGSTPPGLRQAGDESRQPIGVPQGGPSSQKANPNPVETYTSIFEDRYTTNQNIETSCQANPPYWLAQIPYRTTPLSIPILVVKISIPTVHAMCTHTRSTHTPQPRGTGTRAWTQDSFFREHLGSMQTPHLAMCSPSTSHIHEGWDAPYLPFLRDNNQLTREVTRETLLGLLLL